MKNITIENTDSTIQYSGNWFPASYFAPNASSRQRGNISITNDLNANFTYKYVYQPIYAFYLFGMKRSTGSFYQICIDCNPDAQYQNFLNVDAYDQTDDGNRAPQALYSISWPTPVYHDIVVSNRGDTRSSNGSSQIAFDRMVFTIDDNASSARTSSGSNRNDHIIEAVVPTVVVVLGITLLIVFLVFRRRRRRRQEREDEMDRQMKEASRVEAFTHIGRSRSRHHDDHVETRIPITLQNSRSNTQPEIDYSNSESHFPASSSNGSESNKSSLGTTQGPLREVDAGPLHEDNLNAMNGVLPPDYADVIRNQQQLGER